MPSMRTDTHTRSYSSEGGVWWWAAHASHVRNLFVVCTSTTRASVHEILSCSPVYLERLCSKLSRTPQC